MPSYRKYARRRPKRSMRTSIKRVVNSLAETKSYRRDMKATMPLSTFGSGVPGYSGYHFNWFSPNYEIAQGTGANERIGKKIHMKGLRVEMVFDNSQLTATVPVYITVLVLLSHSNDSPNVDLYKGFGSTGAENLPETITEEWKHELHSRPINTSRYRVIARSALRLGCKAEPDMPGPRFAQRVAYFPLNSISTYDGAPGGTFNIKPRLSVVVLATNPTQLDATAGSMKYEINSVLYYKDI